ncbi:MAG: hypothetical protein KTR31_41960 [Myxococcales bacterium]|nr:hypothetical protein [Myxococcales bacterium]
MTVLRWLPLMALAAACGGDVETPDGENEEEVITTVVLTFAPQGGGAAVEASWVDVEGDGNPVIDDIVLADGTAYDLSVAFLNELEDPAEDITEEIADEDDEHQIFVTGSGVQGPATGTNANAVVEHAYADMDGEGLPIGLANTVTALAAGTGDFVITLRHMPPEDGNAVKVAGAAEDVAASGFGAIGGDNDVEATFPIEVQ